MRIILGVLPSVYSLYFINHYLRVQKCTLEAVVVSTKPVVIDRRPVLGILDINFLIQRFGFSYFGFLLANQWLLSKVNRQSEQENESSKLWNLNRLSDEYGFSLIYADDFNSDDTINIINEINPNYFLINGCDQILSPRFLNRSRPQAINIHPSLLPDDRGVDPVFQKLLRGDFTCSTSLHQISAEIDRGPIYCQSRQNLGSVGSYLEFSMAHAVLASEILQAFLQNPNDLKPQKENAQHPYKSWPQKHEIQQFKQKGGRFLSKAAIHQFLNFTFTHC
ncbi:formyltransferase family protein [Sessilibacter corallicola]|uniref:formyltransferase family protein n=1 Tax=Sessilibacter corallicola TaxID=2904075 RepID=UPI001E645586|nr:formyltransferase family protein [Sessilibacter corallicola]MCE2027950.1 hypothetical protein [Sessilibacter corallicola]